jgi:secondary thiamine-phosphate synthase enzyme
MTLAPGARLGPYEIVAPIGAGGMGEVYRARDTRLGRIVAIKVLRGDLAADADRIERFEREARSASALNHPNIVTICETGEFGSDRYIAMQRVGDRGSGIGDPESFVVSGFMVSTHRKQIATRGQGDAHDVTDAVAAAVRESAVTSGLVTVFVVGSTAGITTIEFEPGAVADLNRLFEQLAPRDAEYRHHLRWGDDNGSSHVRAALLGPSVTIPVVDGQPVVGTWQQIMLLEFDTRPRRREIVIQVVGDR